MALGLVCFDGPWLVGSEEPVDKGGDGQRGGGEKLFPPRRVGVCGLGARGRYGSCGGGRCGGGRRGGGFNHGRGGRRLFVHALVASSCQRRQRLCAPPAPGGSNRARVASWRAVDKPAVVFSRRRSASLRGARSAMVALDSRVSVYGLLVVLGLPAGFVTFYNPSGFQSELSLSEYRSLASSLVRAALFTILLMRPGVGPVGLGDSSPIQLHVRHPWFSRDGSLAARNAVFGGLAESLLLFALTCSVCALITVLSPSGRAYLTENNAYTHSRVNSVCSALDHGLARWVGMFGFSAVALRCWWAYRASTQRTVSDARAQERVAWWCSWALTIMILCGVIGMEPPLKSPPLHTIPYAISSLIMLGVVIGVALYLKELQRLSRLQEVFVAVYMAQAVTFADYLFTCAVVRLVLAEHVPPTLPVVYFQVTMFLNFEMTLLVPHFVLKPLFEGNLAGPAPVCCVETDCCMKHCRGAAAVRADESADERRPILVLGA
jgi:hypothetical protein